MFPYTIPRQPDQNCKYQLSYRIQYYSMLPLFCFCEVLEPQEPYIVSYFPVHFSKLLSQYRGELLKFEDDKMNPRNFVSVC